MAKKFGSDRTEGGPEAAQDSRGRPPDEGDLLLDDDSAKEYREGVYHPVEVEELPDAPESDEFPNRGSGAPFKHHDAIPRAPRLRHIIGPSVIALGMGLGAGEFLLWPNLIAVNGLSIFWLFWVGVLAQFIVIGEIERWTVATGESIFGGMRRVSRFAFWPWFFLVATLAGFFWPGWASQSATLTLAVVNSLLGTELTQWQPVALGMMVFIYVALAVSRVVYNSLEKFEIILVVAFFPMLFIAVLLSGVSLFHLGELAKGIVPNNDVPATLVSGEQFPTLLLAVAYAGSGGTLLLAQSLWIRDKGFGLAAYQGRIAGIKGTNEPVMESGFAFSSGNPLARERFRRWMRVAHLELLVTFAIPILLSVVITGLIVAGTIGLNNPDLAGDLSGTVGAMGETLRSEVGAWLQVVFLLGGALVLFATQVGIVDTVTRNTGDIFFERVGRNMKGVTIKNTFLAFLTVFTLAGMAVIAIAWAADKGIETEQSIQPDFLILIAGPFTIASMYAFAAVIAILNTRHLPQGQRMSRTRLVGMWFAMALWGWFTAEQITRSVLGEIGAPAVDATTISMHPVRVVAYLLWVSSLLYVIARTVGPGFAGDQPAVERREAAPAS